MLQEGLGAAFLCVLWSKSTCVPGKLACRGPGPTPSQPHRRSERLASAPVRAACWCSWRFPQRAAAQGLVDASRPSWLSRELTMLMQAFNLPTNLPAP
jgi:hypothetical protein